MDQRERRLREEISRACRNNDLPAAAEKYLQLVRISEDVVLPRNQQLDIANQLMADQRHPAAADAYERYLSSYAPNRGDPDISLMLGLLYGRYLHQYDRAREYLQRAIESLHDPRKRQLAEEILAEVGSRS
jgi:tetratricopeptide (TPR) repeat protein